MKRSVACLVVLTSLLVASPASAKPSLDGVREASAASGQSLAGAIEAARDGQVRRAVAQFHAAEDEARTAAIKARRLTAMRPVRGSEALELAAANADLAFADLSELIALLPPHAQAAVAEALGQFASIRANVIARLTELAESLPEPARTQVFEAIARFHDVGDLDALLEAIGSSEVTDMVRGQLAGIFDMVTAQLDEVFVQLEGLLDRLPPEAAAVVGGVLDELQATLEHVFSMLDGVLAILPGGGGLGHGSLGNLCGIFDSLPIPLPIDIPILCR